MHFPVDKATTKAGTQKSGVLSCIWVFMCDEVVCNELYRGERPLVIPWFCWERSPLPLFARVLKPSIVD